LRHRFRHSRTPRESHTEGYQCHPPGFAEWTTPEWIVVSGGPRDRLPDVAAAYETRGARVLHTADRGAVQVVIRGEKLSIDCYRTRSPADAALASE
jgi:hypothetical protein